MATNGKIPQKMLQDNSVGAGEIRTDALGSGIKGGGGVALAVEPTDFAGAGLADVADQLAIGDVNRGVQVNADDLQVDASEIAGDGLQQRAGGGNEHILDLDLIASGGLKIVSGEVGVEPADFAGNGLEDDGSDNLRINTSTATVTFTGGTWTFPASVLQINSAPVSANDAVNKDYVDGLISGIAWKDPVKVTEFIGERTITQINALSPSSGWAVVATDAGTPTAGTSDALAAGDLAEFDGTSWIRVYDNVAGQLPAGVRVIVSTTAALFSPLTDATDDGKILVSVADPGTINGAASDWDDTGDAVDGNAVLVQCPPGNTAPSVNENNGYVFDGVVPTGSWIQFTGAGQINAGAGLTKTGSTLNIGDINRGVQVNADDLQIDASEIVNSTSGLQQVAGGGNEHILELKLHSGADGVALTKDTNGLNLDGDKVNIDFTPSNYTPDATPAEADDVDDLAAHLKGIDNALAGLGGTPFQESLTTQLIAGTDTTMTDTLTNLPVSAESVKLYYFGVLLTQGAGQDYTVNPATGAITWLASTGTAPDQATSEPLVAVYEY